MLNRVWTKDDSSDHKNAGEMSDDEETGSGEFELSFDHGGVSYFEKRIGEQNRYTDGNECWAGGGGLSGEDRVAERSNGDGETAEACVYFSR